MLLETASKVGDIGVALVAVAVLVERDVGGRRRIRGDGRFGATLLGAGSGGFRHGVCLAVQRGILLPNQWDLVTC